MEEQEWKDIIDELSQQNASISIERAVARAQIKTCMRVIEKLQNEIRELTNKSNEEATIQTVTKE
jgi:DNA anti-recombination protein RmuC